MTNVFWFLKTAIKFYNSSINAALCSRHGGTVLLVVGNVEQKWLRGRNLLRKSGKSIFNFFFPKDF